MKKCKKLSKKLVIIISLVSILICVFISGGIYMYSKLNKVNTVAIPKTNEDLGIDSVVDQKLESKEITNIALFGVDSRDTDSNVGSRSDTIMILSIDEVHNKVKITSIMRDTYVNVEGHGMTKITHAYAYAGPKLAIKTINSNFDMNIKDYVTVDFFGLSKIIDAIGGVEINVKKAEIPYVKNGVTSPGLQLLNGEQAVAYSRIRYQGNGDYERTERQRTVIEGLFKRVSNQGVLKYNSLLNSILPDVETSLSSGDLISIGTKVISSDIKNIDQLRLPMDGYCKGELINKIYYLVADLNAAKKQLYSFIYE